MVFVGNNLELYYSEFLHEGDYARYQPNINLNVSSREYLVESLQAHKEYARGIWILNRLTRFGDTHWSLLNQEWQTHYNMILYYQKQIKSYDDYSRSESKRRTKTAQIIPSEAVV